jgi:two-component system response regulator LytT
MKAIIIEDEKYSALHLQTLIQENFPEIEIISLLRSVTSSIEWLSMNTEPDLIFIDIELSDGTCFEILDQIKPKSRLIFTTAYDQHAIKAFDYNSIAYLLKPITKEKLTEVIKKINSLPTANNIQIIEDIKKHLQPTNYKKRFLVKRGDKFWQIPAEEIAYFVSEEGLTVGYLFDKRNYFIEYTLDALLPQLDPSMFFRINRKVILNINAIQTVKTYFSRRLLLDITPEYEEDIIVSKERVSEFKKWLDE